MYVHTLDFSKSVDKIDWCVCWGALLCGNLYVTCGCSCPAVPQFNHGVVRRALTQQQATSLHYFREQFIIFWWQ